MAQERKTIEVVSTASYIKGKSRMEESGVGVGVGYNCVLGKGGGRRRVSARSVDSGAIQVDSS